MAITSKYEAVLLDSCDWPELHVREHGWFSANAEIVRLAMKMSRAELLSLVLGIYEGSTANSRTVGSKKSDWKTHPKLDLAFIVASTIPEDIREISKVALDMHKVHTT